MGLRFYKRIRLAPGVTMNLSRSGPSFSFGPRGFKYTVGRNGTRQTFGIPGTGVSYTTTSPWLKKAPAAQEPRLDLGFFGTLLVPGTDRLLIAGLKQFLSGDLAGAHATFVSDPAHPDSQFMAGFIALGYDRFNDSAAAFALCTKAGCKLGQSMARYTRDFHLSLQITDFIDVPIAVDGRGLALARIEALQGLARYPEAIQIARGQLIKNSGDSVLCLSLCELVAKYAGATRDDLEEVVVRTSSVENQAPIDTNILYLRCAALFRLRMLDVAASQLGSLLRRKKDRPQPLIHQIRYLRGHIYEQMNEVRKARSEYELIYADNPNFRDVGSRLMAISP